MIGQIEPAIEYSARLPGPFSTVLCDSRDSFDAFQYGAVRQRGGHESSGRIGNIKRVANGDESYADCISSTTSAWLDRERFELHLM